MATVTTSASISLSANGRSTAYGNLTWTMPSLPSDATITDIHVSGSYSWTGRGTITYVTINGTHAYPDSSFDISLGASATSPYQISCIGNKNATGSHFSWSGLTITITYTVPVVDTDKLYVKQNGSWVEVTPYKKVNGSWVLQTDVTNVFQSGVNYKQG